MNGRIVEFRISTSSDPDGVGHMTLEGAFDTRLRLNDCQITVRLDRISRKRRLFANIRQISNIQHSSSLTDVLINEMDIIYFTAGGWLNLFV